MKSLLRNAVVVLLISVFAAGLLAFGVEEVLAQASNPEVGLDLIAPILIGFGAVAAARSGQAALLDIALIVGVIGFLGSVGFAMHLERTGAGGSSS